MEALRKQLAEAQAKERIGEMNSAISNFSEEERAFAKDEIAAFEADPMNCEINSIVNRIYSEIGKKAKENEAIVSEQNANQTIDTIDIFSEVVEINSASLDDDSIF